MTVLKALFYQFKCDKGGENFEFFIRFKFKNNAAKKKKKNLQTYVSSEGKNKKRTIFIAIVLIDAANYT